MNDLENAEKNNHPNSKKSCTFMATKTLYLFL
jgi:hypothetical protein